MSFAVVSRVILDSHQILPFRLISLSARYVSPSKPRISAVIFSHHSSTRIYLVAINRNQDGRTALVIAAENGHTNCVRMLLESGAELEASSNVRKSNAFDYQNAVKT
jgi:hypothetical protein